MLFKQSVSEKDFSVSSFQKALQPAAKIDFTDSFFQTSGTGRGRIRNAISLCVGLLTLKDLEGKFQAGKMKETDLAHYTRLTQ